MRDIKELPILEYTWNDVHTGRYLPKVMDFVAKHGPLFRYKVPEMVDANQLVLIGPEANRFVFHTGRQHFSHEKGWTPILGEIVGRGLINMDDPDHSAHRKMWNPAFTNDVMESYIPILHKIIRNKLNAWAEMNYVNLHKEAQEITFDVAAAALAGEEEGERLDKLREIFWVILHGSEVETHAEYLEMMDRLRAEMLPLLLNLIQEQRISGQNGDGHKNVLSQIANARFDDGSTLNDIEILGHLNVLLLAGHETTTSLTAWLIYLLATLPNHWDRLRAEVDEVISDIEIGDLTKVPSSEQLRRLTEVENFIKETGRLYPPVFNVPRVTLSDCELHGVKIPEGTSLRLCLAATHLLPDVFDNPNEFDPSRFAPPRREDRATPYSLVTFGGGPRICIGINFAMIEVKVIVAHVLRHYELAANPDSVPQHVGHINAVPAFPLEVAFTPREGG